MPRTKLLHLAAAHALALSIAAQGDHVVLDDTPRDFTNFNAEAVRPLALAADGDLFALHTHASQVVRFSGSPGSEPMREVARFDTPLFPVALAFAEDDLLVGCEGTRCLVRMDPDDGTVRAVLPLPSEPGDLVVNPLRRRAYVACAGLDLLVQVNLVDFTITRTYTMRSKRPRFLSIDSDGSVLVAPTVSGNNTGLLVGEIVDLADPSVSPNGLPDSDLFRLGPLDTALRPVLRSMGSLLFAHGRHPVTGDYWMLNVESLNADPARQGEAALDGNFARNRLTIASLPATGPGALLHTVDLDDVDPGTDVRYERARSVSQPFGLTFARDGRAFVAAPSADMVAVLDRDAQRIADLRLPEGTIPLATLVDEHASVLWVHGWGSSHVFGFRLRPLEPLPFVELDLGPDPTPPSVRAGREVFYDASLSAHGRLTCNHCHPGGRADGLGWDLSARPFDDKGPLVTQTLFGLESKFPYHWRGERSFGDFNTAFRDLLGRRAPLPAAAFADLESFLFSLQQPSNPRADLSRRLVPRAGEGDPAVGQQVFTSADAVGDLSCNDCHALPLGTTADVVAFQGFPLAARNHIDAPALGDGGLLFKDQPEVGVTVNGTSTSMPLMGAGFGSVGGVARLETFLLAFPGLPDQADLRAFLEQFDDGLAPAAQAAWLFAADSPPETANAIESVLLEQALHGWIDVVAWGTTELAGEMRHVRWWFDPQRERFVADDPDFRVRSWPELWSETLAGRTRNVVQGLPPGNGRGFALARGGAELASESGPRPVFRVLPRFLWANGSVAKLTFETEQPTEWEIRYRTVAGATRIAHSRDRARVHTAVLQDLEPSTRDLVDFVYQGDVTVTDENGKSATVPMPTFTTGYSVTPAESRVAFVGSATWERADWDADALALDAEASFRLLRKAGRALELPAADHVLVARLIVDGVVHTEIAGPSPTTFTVSGQPYDALAGPFLFSTPSAASDGLVRVRFEARELRPGAELVLHVVAIPTIDPATYDASAPAFDGFATIAWSIPDTAPELRQLAFAIPRSAPGAVSAPTTPLATDARTIRVER